MFYIEASIDDGQLRVTWQAHSRTLHTPAFDAMFTTFVDLFDGV